MKSIQLPAYAWLHESQYVIPSTLIFDTNYFAEYFTFRKSKGMYYQSDQEISGTYFILNHVLNLSFHGDDKKDAKV